MIVALPPCKITRNFQSDPLEVRKTLDVVTAEFRTMGVGIEEIGSVELVLAEVLNNISEHAYQERVDGQIDLEITCVETGIQCKVQDYGLPMPNGSHPLSLAPNLDVQTQDMPEGGFGWFLIGELANDLTYTRKDNTNKLSFRMNISV